MRSGRSSSGSILATDLYTTDAEIAAYGLCVLEDDLRYFPVYTAVLLYREELKEGSPAAVGGPGPCSKDGSAKRT